MRVGLHKLTKWRHFNYACANILFFGLFAQPFTLPQTLPKFRFDSWTTENGLPQNTVNDILQTRDGYLWLATNDGLVRFDGIRFTVFDKSTEGIKSQRLRVLLEDSKGTLWVGTEDGMLIRYSDRKFMTYTAQDGLPHAQASMLEEDGEGNLWITWHGPIIATTKFDGKRFINYGPEDFTHGVNGDSDRKRYPWWNQNDEGLHYLVKGQVKTFFFQENMSKTQVAGVSIDKQGNLWIQINGSGVIKVKTVNLRYTIIKS